jgi:SAM-dependent methyltransferase
MTRTSQNPDKIELSRLYDESFYEGQVGDSLTSARIFLQFLWKYLQPGSVLDVGCGRGAWLKAFGELGTSELIGLDGHWNSQSQMIDETIAFRTVDLEGPFELGRRFDLAMSLEVAEHLRESSAEQFVERLAQASDVVLFSAAFRGQGGINHTNEQPHSYWAKKFEQRDFAPFDLFRPTFWGDERICYWYRQNTFLYAKRGSASYNKLRGYGVNSLENISFMDCIHPASRAGLSFKLASKLIHYFAKLPQPARKLARRLISPTT